MTESTKPVFIVGSPRSGTSILTWCLGRHPHIMPLPETNWIGKLAEDLGSTYALGSARGKYSHLSAMGITSAEFYETFGDSINDLILRHPRKTGSHSPLDLERWVDGTPENSFHIPGLLSLFPHAKFIHILRDVGSVVKSLMNFSNVGASDFTEQAAYEKWLRAVQACVQAERDFGPETVLRIRYADLVSSPEQVLRSLLDFLNEPFCAECLEPLKTKINSSNVPSDFDPYDANTDPVLRDEAERLSQELLEGTYPRYAPNKEGVGKLETAPVERTKSVGSSEPPDRQFASGDSKLHRPGVDRQKFAVSNEDLVQKLKARNKKLKARCDSLEHELYSIKNSRSWRLFNLYRRLRTKLTSSEELETASIERAERVGSSEPGRQKALDTLDKTPRKNPTDVSWETISKAILKNASEERHLDEIPKLLSQILRSYLKPSLYPEYFRVWEDCGFHLTPVHYYSPIPDTRTLTDELWAEESALVGIDLNEDVQLHLLQEAFPRFRAEYDQFPMTPTAQPYEFYFENGMFGGTDALVLYCMVRHFRPNLVLEVGSGFSSRVSAQAALRNGHTKLICIEPHPDEVLREGFPGLTSLIPKKVQEVELSYFEELGPGDILFIDSSHVVKIGGDVNHLFLEVIPRLKPGVIVHVHDIFIPSEYRQDWVMNELRFWTEQYLLQAFLTFNSEYEVLLCNNYLGSKHHSELQTAFPNSPWWGGGSFWMRRRERS